MNEKPVEEQVWEMQTAFSGEIAVEVDVRCDHPPEAHLPSLHGRSNESRIWAPGFCRAVLRGLRRQLKLDNKTCDDLADQLYEIDHDSHT